MHDLCFWPGGYEQKHSFGHFPQLIIFNNRFTVLVSGTKRSINDGWDGRILKIFLVIMSVWQSQNWLSVSCVQHDFTPHLVYQSVHKLVGRSVTILLFYVFYSFTLLLLPKWSRNLWYSPCPPTCNWGSCVSRLVQVEIEWASPIIIPLHIHIHFQSWKKQTKQKINIKKNKQ